MMILASKFGYDPSDFVFQEDSEEGKKIADAGRSTQMNHAGSVSLLFFRMMNGVDWV